MNATMLIALALVPTAAARSQEFEVDWFSIDGGGGRSVGGDFVVNGTIGQPDAGVMTGGAFVVVGGFWSWSPEPGFAPILTISLSQPDTVTVSWAPNGFGFVLQETIALSPPNWTDSPSGSANPAVAPVNSGTKFYRVIKRQ